ncbi:cytochrome P450 oxidoreductase [Xylariomycetidae sp. FL0641]|nr:cytochrome P450 oxidoreductase [Xylariomycetidae sp. FL0641]
MGAILSLPSLAAALVALAAYVVGWIVYARNFHPLSKVPGPWLASVSRTWYMYQITRGDMEKTQRQLHAKFGPLIRIAPNELACAEPDAIKTIYRTTGALNKTDFYLPWNGHNFSKHRDAFTETNDKKHGERRRIVNGVYTLANVLKSEKYIDKCTELFKQRLGEFADAKKEMDLGHWLQMYAFDVIGELYFGSAFGFLERAEDHGEWIQSLDLLMPFLCVTSVGPSYLRPLILGSAIAVPGSLKALKAIDNIGDAARSVVRKRFDQGQKADGEETRTDLLEQLYGIHVEKGFKVDFNMGEIEQEAFVAIFAGSDTTAIGFRGVFYNLTKNPALYAEVQAEIDAATAAGRLSSPVKYSEAIQLPLVCACVKEALRTHPGVQLTMARHAPAEGMMLCGTFVPAGYRVGMNPAVVHYDRGVFGEDADVFRPQRWLEGDTARMDRAMLHFGAGTRTCIGKNISIAEIHKMVPEVLREFRFELAEPQKNWTTRNLWFCKQTGINVRVSRREV